MKEWTPNEESHHFDHLVGGYVKQVERVNIEKNTLFVDFNGAMAKLGDDLFKDCLSDGLHLSQKVS